MPVLVAAVFAVALVAATFFPLVLVAVAVVVAVAAAAVAVAEAVLAFFAAAVVVAVAASFALPIVAAGTTNLRLKSRGGGGVCCVFKILFLISCFLTVSATSDLRGTSSGDP